MIVAKLTRSIATPRVRGSRVVLALLLGTLSVPTGVCSQERPETPLAAEKALPLPPINISPGGAFLRSIVIPGWGHTAIGSYSRGAFYFGAQTATVYTFFRTRERLTEVRERVRFREQVVRAQLAAEGITGFAEIEQGLDEDASLTDLRNLKDSRDQQREDLIALGVFMLLLSGADAYVSAHLARFPEPLELEARPVGDGRVEVGLRLMLPN